jgi:hypothetical protein
VGFFYKARTEEIGMRFIGNIYPLALFFYALLVFNFFAENWEGFNLNVFLLLTIAVIRGDFAKRKNEN